MASTLLISLNNINKHFGGVQALRDIDFNLRSAQVHTLLGMNGAGKSTLVKVIMGVVQPDSGEIIINEKKVKISSPIDAQKLGISIVYQELSLIKDLSVAENIFLGRFPKKFNGLLLDWDKLYYDTEKALIKLKVKIDPRTIVSNLSIAQQQIIEITKALSINPKILILDEPTSALSYSETNALFNIINILKNKQKVGIIYISHRLAEVERISDYITILRDGRKIYEGDMANTTKKNIVKHILGSKLSKTKKITNKNLSEEIVLSVQNLTRKNVLNDISFDLYKGEILGIAGLVGAKRTELVRTIFGADLFENGKIIVKNKYLKKQNPIISKKMGIALVPEDRKSQGIIEALTVKKNISIGILNLISKFNIIQRKKETDTVNKQIKNYKVKLSNINESINNLSGGNQQKVVLVKWLTSGPDILLLDEPTRGIDVGTKSEIIDIVRKLTLQGKSVIFISSELEEVIDVSDRILIMYNGKIVGKSTINDPKTLGEIMITATGN